jgi:hypothetical protein
VLFNKGKEVILRANVYLDPKGWGFSIVRFFRKLQKEVGR